MVYRQQRVGWRGEIFTMFKFRTMQHDRRSDRGGSRRPDRRSGQSRRWTHKTNDDPRHARLGRFLRATSLDELPQLLNVLRGEVSLVGPRPELPEVVAGYGAWQHARHQVKPGITAPRPRTGRSRRLIDRRENPPQRGPLGRCPQGAASA